LLDRNPMVSESELIIIRRREDSSSEYYEKPIYMWLAGFCAELS
jgi:hypothetical protein